MNNIKNIVITGASSGIGRYTAITLSKYSDYSLILTGRNKSELELTSKMCLNPDNVTTVVMDLNQLFETENQNRWIELMSSKQNLFALIHNAAIYETASVYLNDLVKQKKLWDKTFQTNLLTPVMLTELLWPYLQKSSKSSVINISSTLGLKPVANTAAYSALKAALNNWTQTLAIEGAPYNIRANVICPGIVDTPIHPFHFKPEEEKSKIKKSLAELQLLNRIGEPTDIAQMIEFLISDKAEWITGSTFTVDGGIQIK